MEVRPYNPKKREEPAGTAGMFEVMFTDLEKFTVREAYRERIISVLPEEDSMLEAEYDDLNEKILETEPELFDLSYCDNKELLNAAGVERLQATLGEFAARTARQAVEIRKEWRAGSSRNGIVIERMRLGRTARAMSSYLNGQMMGVVFGIDPSITTDTMSTSTDIVHVDRRPETH
jgi:hypothetical protein